ncbi:hypothetical protein GIB67_014054 [Kingdonia uniflora]|uniref:Homeobox protein knotted-1-like 6 n=1 Tax=Kingdonia uniflora TaxID=39325 RepID=A0A7J7KX88_9MAGN|nr:hypothetical protein GIB67_014054 [Kingdonia uniflora]
MEEEEDIYGLQAPLLDYSQQQQQQQSMISPLDYQTYLNNSIVPLRDRIIPMFGSDDHQLLSEMSSSMMIVPQVLQGSVVIGDVEEDEITRTIKAKIASHPRYPSLLQAYIDCQKVGAPPEIACVLDELRRENDVGTSGNIAVSRTTRLGADPELDEFMNVFCDVLMKYKSDLARPFDEATAFLNKIEIQLSNLSNKGGASRSSASPG